MDLQLGLRAAGWGALLMLIAAGPRIEALEEWPAALEWLKLASFLAASFAAGAIAYLRPPKNGNGKPPTEGR